MMEYPYDSIWINGRLVMLEEIKNSSIPPLSTFEQHTFEFINDWLSGRESFILQTSGSTGSPKKITITRDQMIASARMTQDALALQAHQSALICLDTQYIGGKMMLVRSFVTGMKMFCVDPTSDPLEKMPVGEWVNLTAMVPLQVQTILGSKHLHLLANIEKIIVGGAPLSETVVDELENYNTTFYATYAMTETISHVALRVLNGVNKRPYFNALPGIKLACDHRNCLIIDAPFLNEPVVTNDVVDLLSSTTFVWIGRSDNIINSGGVKINPERTEATIAAVFQKIGLAYHFFISSEADLRLGEKVVLVIEAEALPIMKMTELVDEIFSTLHPYEVPKELLFSKTFYMLPSGKINRVKSMDNILLRHPVSKDFSPS